MGRTTWFDDDGVRKGEWTVEEDRMLVAYINEYGLGDWRTMPKRAGLQRCGKSCRLRWLNYLRPGIKRGKFTPQEEEDIIKFHSLLGNRLVTDIPATTGTNFGNEIVSYESPRPNSGIHRIVLVLFRQLGRQTVYEPGWRQQFNTREFASLYNLGLPVAAVFYNCQRESGCGGRRS